MSDQDHGHSSPNLIKDEDVTMKIQHVLAIATLFTSNNGVAAAGETISETGALACVTDKWDEKELEKGHKLVDYASRCIIIPDDAASPKVTESCAGKFEYLADGSWKGSGTCADTYKSGGTKAISWEEGSHLKEYSYKVTGGTGKFEGATGGGSYLYENLTDTLSGGRLKGQVKVP